ncbi:MAG: metallophosphoesterase [Elusimicrobiota bacterium]|nr:metallophosphoesterase [Elusimicrobiota bacterium]
MKIAITADLHLKEGRPERYETLESIFSRCRQEKIENIIIAGDLFDKDMTNYADFEKICRKKKFKSLNIYVIPGNHDAGFSSKMIDADNVKVVSASPEVIDIDGVSFLFVPYDGSRNMGEAIAPFSEELEEKEWVLIGHGDWLQRTGALNPMEPGIYMPLSDTDIRRYRPSKIILGHIHKIIDSPKIHYPGSPVPMHINETGKRRYIHFDTETMEVSSVPTDSPLIYQSQELVMLPVDDIKSYVKEEAVKLKKKWNLNKEDIKKTRIRLKVTGYAPDKKEAAAEIEKNFSEFKFYEDEEADLSGLHIAGSEELNEIASMVKEHIGQKLEWDFSDPLSPSETEVLMEALKAVYE